MTVQGLFLKCSPTEAVALASIAGGDHLVGLPDPFPGWTGEEMQAALRSARATLTERGVLRGSPPKWEVHPSYSRIVSLLVGPRAIFTLSQQRRSAQTATEQQVRTFFALYWLPPDLISVQTSQLGLQMEQTGLTEAFARLEAFLNIPGKPRDSRRLYLPSDSLASILGNPAEVARQEMMAFGLEESEADTLLRALRRPEQAGAVCSFQRASDGSWAAEGLTFLTFGDGLWRVRQNQRGRERWTEIVGTYESEFSEHVIGLARRLLRV